MNLEKRFKIFPWAKIAYGKLHESFGLEKENQLTEALLFIVISTKSELSEIIKGKQIKKAKELFNLLKECILHLHLQNIFSSSIKEGKMSCLKILSYLLDLCFFVNYNDPDASYLELGSCHLLLCLGNNVKSMWDVLLRCTLLKKKYSQTCCPLLRRVLMIPCNMLLSPKEYMKCILLLRLWKVFTPDKTETSQIVSIASKIEISGNILEYLESLGTSRKPQNLSKRGLAKFFICKKFPADFFFELKKLLCSDTDMQPITDSVFQQGRIDDRGKPVDSEGQIVHVTEFSRTLGEQEPPKATTFDNLQDYFFFDTTSTNVSQHLNDESGLSKRENKRKHKSSDDDVIEISSSSELPDGCSVSTAAANLTSEVEGIPKKKVKRKSKKSDAMIKKKDAHQDSECASNSVKKVISKKLRREIVKTPQLEHRQPSTSSETFEENLQMQVEDSDDTSYPAEANSSYDIVAKVGKTRIIIELDNEGTEDRKVELRLEKSNKNNLETSKIDENAGSTDNVVVGNNLAISCDSFEVIANNIDQEMDIATTATVDCELKTDEYPILTPKQLRGSLFKKEKSFSPKMKGSFMRLNESSNFFNSTSVDCEELVCISNDVKMEEEELSNISSTLSPRHLKRSTSKNNISIEKSFSNVQSPVKRLNESSSKVLNLTDGDSHEEPVCSSSHLEVGNESSNNISSILSPRQLRGSPAKNNIIIEKSFSIIQSPKKKSPGKRLNESSSKVLKLTDVDSHEEPVCSSGHLEVGNESSNNISSILSPRQLRGSPAKNNIFVEKSFSIIQSPKKKSPGKRLNESSSKVLNLTDVDSHEEPVCSSGHLEVGNELSNNKSSILSPRQLRGSPAENNIFSEKSFCIIQSPKKKSPVKRLNESSSKVLNLTDVISHDEPICISSHSEMGDELSNIRSSILSPRKLRESPAKINTSIEKSFSIVQSPKKKSPVKRFSESTLKTDSPKKGNALEHTSIEGLKLSSPISLMESNDEIISIGHLLTEKSVSPNKNSLLNSSVKTVSPEKRQLFPNISSVPFSSISSTANADPIRNYYHSDSSSENELVIDVTRVSPLKSPLKRISTNSLGSKSPTKKIFPEVRNRNASPESSEGERESSKDVKESLKNKDGLLNDEASALEPGDMLCNVDALENDDCNPDLLTLYLSDMSENEELDCEETIPLVQTQLSPRVANINSLRIRLNEDKVISPKISSKDVSESGEGYVPPFEQIGSPKKTSEHPDSTTSDSISTALKLSNIYSLRTRTPLKSQQENISLPNVQEVVKKTPDKHTVLQGSRTRTPDKLPKLTGDRKVPSPLKKLKSPVRNRTPQKEEKSPKRQNSDVESDFHSLNSSSDDESNTTAPATNKLHLQSPKRSTKKASQEVSDVFEIPPKQKQAVILKKNLVQSVRSSPRKKNPQVEALANSLKKVAISSTKAKSTTKKKQSSIFNFYGTNTKIPRSSVTTEQDAEPESEAKVYNLRRRCAVRKLMDD